MKLLIVTQAVDDEDPILGFFCRWLTEFAKHCEHIEVICLQEGKHELPANVHVHSLGKEHGTASRATYARRFLSLVWRLRRKYDVVFVHMNPEYVILAGPLWRLWRKHIGLWYTHGTVSLRLRFAVLLARTVFTASEASMRVHTSKKRVVGHGLDLAEFPFAPAPVSDTPLSLVTIGRRSIVKRIEMLERAAALAGERLTVIEGVSHARIPDLLAGAHLFLHASATGSLDKAPLEALASGVPVITANDELGRSGSPGVITVEPSAESFAAAISQAREVRPWADNARREAARAWVVGHHNLARLIPAILALL